ncbi:MAG: slipin family protein [Candidatus Aenigmarchaeota archaeon]|nr:slipin family protein [Candidatus Aenigmarchaeota archaeon]
MSSSAATAKTKQTKKASFTTKSPSWWFPIAFFVLSLILYALQNLLYTLTLVIFFVSLSGIKIIYEYERGIRFRLGSFTGVLGPGLNYVIPVFEKLIKLDTRVITVDIPVQEVMTKDNVPVKIDAVVYFRVLNPERAILDIQDYHMATKNYAQTALRDVLGDSELDRVLVAREEIAKEIREIVDEQTDEWGIDVVAIKLQHIELPENMKRTMAKQAEAERERRAVIIKAQGEVTASKDLATAANTLHGSPGALHLRTLNSLNDLSSDQSNTVVFAIPLEVLRAFESVSQFLGNTSKPAKPKKR